MKRAWGIAAIALMFALSGCTDGDSAGITDAVEVNNVPACLTWPVELAGDTYWEMPEDQVDEWIASHEMPDSQAVSGEQGAVVLIADTPQVYASAAWDDVNDSVGILYRYDDGTALFVAVTGNRIYFTDVEREFDAVC